MNENQKPPTDKMHAAAAGQIETAAIDRCVRGTVATAAIILDAAGLPAAFTSNLLVAAALHVHDKAMERLAQAAAAGDGFVPEELALETYRRAQEFLTVLYDTTGIVQQAIDQLRPQVDAHLKQAPGAQPH